MTESRAFREWKSTRQEQLDELEQAHTAMGGGKVGRRWLTTQVNNAYVIAIAAQFQGFCRDLHTEAALAITEHLPVHLQPLTAGALTSRRALDRGNAFPAKIGEDFRLLGIELWKKVEVKGKTYVKRRERLEILILWRNCLAHEAPMSIANQEKTAGTKPVKRFAREWRKNCAVLASSFDRVVTGELTKLLGVDPWA